jgi:hypothetical protein
VNESHGYPFQRREDEAKPEAADQADANENELKKKYFEPEITFIEKTT